jgi:hypothetical protein
VIAACVRDGVYAALMLSLRMFIELCRHWAMLAKEELERRKA